MPAKASFIEPMLLLRTDKLPDDSTRWAYQLKLDGYRAIALIFGYYDGDRLLYAARTRIALRDDKDPEGVLRE